MTETNTATFINPKSGVIRLSKLRSDVAEEIFCSDREMPWMLGLIEEINEQVDEEDRELPGYPSYLEFKGTITKLKNSKYEEMVLIKGELYAQYVTYCINTGAVMNDSLEAEIRIGAIDKENSEKFGFDQEVIDVEINGEELDLYYFNDNELDLRAIFHEYIYLNKNPYPKLPEQ